MNNKIFCSIFLIFWCCSINIAQIIEQDIEEEIPVFKRINPLTSGISYQFTFRPSYYIPLKGTSSYINKGGVKPVAVSFEIVKPTNYSIGVELGQQYYQQYKERALYDYDGSLISTAQMRTMNNFPIAITYSKYFKGVDKTVRPYAQLGLGVMKINYVNYWGYLIDDKKRWAPMGMASVGVKINLDNTGNWVLDSKIKYQIAPFQYDFISNVNYLAFDIGIGFRWWDE